jgi:hypothetical protein
VDFAVGIGVAVLCLLLLAGTLIWMRAIWTGLRDERRRRPLDLHRRRRGLFGGALAAIWVVAGTTLAIAAPWGTNSFFYVIVIGGGALMLLSLIGVSVHAVQESRQAKRRRTQRES